MSDPYPSLYPHEEPTEQASGPLGYQYDPYLIPPPPPSPPHSHWKLWAGGVLALLLLVNALLVGYILGSHQGGQTVSALPSSNLPVSAVATTVLPTPTQMPSPTPTPIMPQICTLHVTDHLMTMTITGQVADQDCNAILAGDPSNFLGRVGVEFYDEGIYLDPSTPDESVVCDFYDKGRRITIRDGGGLYYGTKYCQALGH